MSSKLKVYELAKELGQDGQYLVEVIQRLGIDIKNAMSVLGSEEVRTVREYFRKHRPLTKATAATPQKSPVTEKRVGATVIRRRAKTEKEEEKVEPAQEVEMSPAEMEAAVTEAEALEMASNAEAEMTASEAEVTEETVEEQTTEPETTELVAEAPAPPPTVEAKAAPAAPARPEPEKKKRFFPSIIKKVATEQYLGEKVGPKPPVAPKKDDSKVGAKPGVAKTAATAGTGVLGDRDPKTGLKRVKEIDLGPLTEAQKEAARRRVLERQDTVFRSTDFLKRELVHATKKKKAVMSRPLMKTMITTPAEHKRVIEMGESITVGDFAKGMGVKATAVVSKLMGMGVTASINERIDFDTATLCAHEFKFEVKQNVFKESDVLKSVESNPENLKPRPPVVTIMGHVDHGKTSLLDTIRKANVAAGEAGGITQHIGAYTVQTPKGKITFLDTPGHEAFTAMRARGAKVTDIVVLVVSAADGVMPQTLESVNHAKAANVPLIVAVNKIDLPDANQDRIKQTLAGHGLNPEEWGGDTIYVGVSAKTGKNVDQLLENILLQAELLELKADYTLAARGAVIESKLDKSRGPLATVLVQQGTLRPGDIAVCGTAQGKVRAMTDSFGKRMTEAHPGDPVEILGLGSVPNVGDELSVVTDDKAARALTEGRTEKQKDRAIEARPKMTLEDMLAGAGGGDKELRVVLKSDVQGSAEALREALLKFPQDRVKLKILHVATGGITESDVMLATASQGVILGFNVRPDVKAQKLAEREGVQIKTYSIIYDMLEDVKNLLEGLLDTTTKEKVIGRAEVRNVFTIPKIGTIAGSAVIDGKVIRGCFLRLLRDSRVIYEGKISSLRRFKDDVKEVASGFECGIGLENFSDLKLGDQFEAFVKEEIKGVL